MRTKYLSVSVGLGLSLLINFPSWGDIAVDGAPKSGELDAITVTASADASAQGVQAAYAGGQVARGGRVGVFGSQDIMETPFSITNYTQELIANTQAESVGDVLQNDPAVRVARGFGNYQQLYMVRGLSVYSDDMSYNGLYGLLPRQYLAAEFLERVEVLHGASAFLNGAAPGGSGLGGAVNVSPKRAPNSPLNEFTVGTESGNQVYLAADIARRFGPQENFGVRFNAVRRSGGTGVEDERRALTAFGLGLDYHQDRFRISADVGYQGYHLGQAQPSITILAGPILRAPDASVNQAQPWSFSNERDTFGTLRAELDVTSHITAWIAGGLRDGHEDSVLANPMVTDSAGDTTQYRFDNARRDLVATGEFGVRAKFKTGSVSQQLIASAAAYQLNSKNAYALSNFAGFAGNIFSPIYTGNPPTNDFFTGGELALPLLTARTKTSSAAVADQLGFLDERVLVSVGARYQKIESFSYDYNSGALSSSYGAHRITPVAGIVVRFTTAFSAYANYVEGLVAGDIAPTTYTDISGTFRNVTNAGEVFRPYATRQGEWGLKYDGGTLGGSVSAFYSAKPVYSVNQATATFEVGDYQRNKGVELSLYGLAAPGVRLLGGGSYLSASVANDRPIGAPRWQANVGAEWDLPVLPGFTTTGRIVETARQFADAANTQEVPSWWRLDLGARYTFSVVNYGITFRGRVDNVTNRNQWVSVGGYPGAGYLVLGTPRTFALSGTLSF